MRNNKNPQLQIYKEVHKIHNEDVELALHSWLPANPDAAIFYFHGLQSHAGWLWEVGAQFASKNIAFFVLDRRGSGISGGTRNEIADAKTTLNDYSITISYVRNLIGDEIPLSLFGHCLGGSFLAALMHYPSFTTYYDSAIFCSTWLGKLHRTLPINERSKLMNNDNKTMWHAGLKATDFTDITQYTNFIDQDDLATRAISQNSRKVLLDLESIYINGNSFKFETLPLAYISGKFDPIINMEDAHNAFLDYISDTHTKISFPTDKHYLFFTNARNNTVNWVSNFILSNQKRNFIAKVA
ncbi:MAG TPA: alpha/beta hydrolase [Aquella sp.]|nr:alpha/beta hydrolase [Aquella sp.]